LISENCDTSAPRPGRIATKFASAIWANREVFCVVRVETLFLTLKISDFKVQT